jgi:hypothetical protein
MNTTDIAKENAMTAIADAPYTVTVDPARLTLELHVTDDSGDYFKTSFESAPEMEQFVARKLDAARVAVRQLPPALAAIREAMLGAGVTAASPEHLDAEGERLAREDRWS